MNVVDPSPFSQLWQTSAPGISNESARLPSTSTAYLFLRRLPPKILATKRAAAESLIFMAISPSNLSRPG